MSIAVLDIPMDSNIEKECQHEYLCSRFTIHSIFLHHTESKFWYVLCWL